MRYLPAALALLVVLAACTTGTGSDTKTTDPSTDPGSNAMDDSGQSAPAADNAMGGTEDGGAMTDANADQGGTVDDSGSDSSMMDDAGSNEGTTDATGEDDSLPDDTGSDGQTMDDTGSDSSTMDDSASSAGETVAMTDVYRYGSISSFMYRSTTTSQGQTQTSDLSYALSTDTVDGKAAWKQVIDVSGSGYTSTTNLWVDKSTYSCLKMTSSTEVMGQTYENAGECPKEGANAAGRTDTPTMTLIGSEMVTVPLGTFQTKVYELDAVKYYMADGVPIPVRVTLTSDDVTSVTELVSYT